MLRVPEGPDDVESTPLDTDQQVNSDLARSTDTLKCTDNRTDSNLVGQQQQVILENPECPDGNMTGDGCTTIVENPECPDGNMTGDGCTTIVENPECPDGNMTEAGCVPPKQTPECPDGNMTEAGCVPPKQTPECPDGNMTGNTSECKSPEGNITPVADAGKDQSVDEGSKVNLDSNTSYDMDGNITSYSWIQIGGYPLVDLAKADISNPSFTAPQVDNDTTMKFELTVTNAKAYFDKDDVNIIIRNANHTNTAVDAGTLKASLIDTESNKAFGLSLLSYSLNDTKVSVEKMDTATELALNNSARVNLVPINPNIELDVLSMRLRDTDGSTFNLNKLKKGDG